MKIVFFELKKIWYKRAWIIPAFIAAILFLWLLAGGGWPALMYVLSGKAAAVREETKIMWGRTYTREVQEYAKAKAEQLGAEMDPWEERESVLGPIQKVKQWYGENSLEASLASFWVAVYAAPNDDENRENFEAIKVQTEARYKAGEISKAQYRQILRASDPMPYEIVPGNTVWQFWLDSEGYLPLISGVATLALLLLFISDVFSMEEGGGLREICFTQPRAKTWIMSKVLASAITGAGIVLALYGGLLLVLGLIFGFQGWNCSPLAYAAGGFVYGDIGHKATTLSLALVRLGVLSLGGATLAVMIATCSAVTRKALSALGLAAFIFGLMESLLFIECAITNALIVRKAAIISAMDFQMLRTFLTTPVRLFFNVEILTVGTKLMSNYSNLMIYNITVTPDLLAVFLSVLLAFMALCAALCFTYQRQR